jgi:hypothetical protein
MRDCIQIDKKGLTIVVEGVTYTKDTDDESSERSTRRVLAVEKPALNASHTWHSTTFGKL